MSGILAGVLPVFALIALGWGLKATRFIPAETWRPIERITYFVFYPGFLIPTIWTAQFEGLTAAPLGAASIAATAAIDAAPSGADDSPSNFAAQIVGIRKPG